MTRVPLRRKAREVAFRTAYQAEIAGDSYARAWVARQEEESLSDDQRELAGDVIALLETRSGDVDDALRAASERWPLERLAATDRAVLRVAIAEMLARPGTPVRVVIDEAIEVARTFGSDESGRFVNGVLDRAARTLRPGEF